MAMATLLVSNTREYLSTTTVTTRLELDVETTEFVELRFNITMEKLPCRFAVCCMNEASSMKHPQ